MKAAAAFPLCLLAWPFVLAGFLYEFAVTGFQFGMHQAGRAMDWATEELES